MLLNDNEQRLSADSFQCTPIVLSSIWTPKDEYSEIIANITATLHMNTPEQTMNGVDIDDFDDNNENKQQQLIEQLKIQLIQDQIKRTQPRNYTHILNQSNTPAQWYKVPPINRSVYFYDPNYQKYVQQRINSLPKTRPNTLSNPSQSLRTQDRSIDHSFNSRNNSFLMTPRTKYMLGLYNTAANHHHQQQKQRLNQNYYSTSRLPLIPTLPPINNSKGRNEQEKNLLNANEKIRQSFLSESRKKINPIVMPPTS